MPTPNSTITSTLKATDTTGQPVDLVTSSCVVTFPDGSTQALAPQSLGNGLYSVTYTTKGPGACLEDWQGTDQTGNRAEFHNITPVSF